LTEPRLVPTEGFQESGHDEEDIEEHDADGLDWKEAGPRLVSALVQRERPKERWRERREDSLMLRLRMAAQAEWVRRAWSGKKERDRQAVDQHVGGQIKMSEGDGRDWLGRKCSSVEQQIQVHKLHETILRLGLDDLDVD
jgi:hypothetical protein